MQEREKESMRVLDLFSGLEGWSAAFRDRKHEITTIDLDYTFNPTFCRDILQIENLEYFGKFDVILASPPCTCFSIASVYVHWKDKKPIDQETLNSINLVKHTLELIKNAKPKFWVLENPMGMLRTIIGKPVYTVDYCQYGTTYKKSTDLWGTFPKDFKPKRCTNKYDHASNKDKFSVQNFSKNPKIRAIVPYKLSFEMCLACERDLLL